MAVNFDVVTVVVDVSVIIAAILFSFAALIAVSITWKGAAMILAAIRGGEIYQDGMGSFYTRAEAQASADAYGDDLSFAFMKLSFVERVFKHHL